MAGEAPNDASSNQLVRLARGAAIALSLAGLAACASTKSPFGVAGSVTAPGAPLRGTDKPYQINGQWYYPKADPHYDEVGVASWYGYPFHDRRTADGELFDQNVISAAHKTLPLPCIVEVTNLKNGRRLRVRVNDRGPFVDGRLIDLSKAAAQQLGFDRAGVTRVRVRYIGSAAPLAAPGLMQAAYPEPPASSPRHAPPRAGSADGFDEIEQADAGGHIQPVARDVEPTPLGAEFDPPPIADAAVAASPLPPLTSSPVATATGVSSGAFSIQAGAYASRAAAERVVARVAAAGGARVSPLQRNGAILYRVTVGAFDDPAAAAQARARLIDIGFSDAKVVPAF